jgi:hypothetical protein
VKFTDGYWQLRDDVQARYPAQVYDVTAEADALIVYAPTRKIEHRGDTLNEPLLTLTATRLEGIAPWQLLVTGQPEIKVPADTDQYSIELGSIEV